MSELLSRDIGAYVDFLPNQYSNSEKIKTFLSIFLDQAQQLEDANVALDGVSTNIDLACGYQLDIIGKLVGAAREGRSDVDYRALIYLKIALNSGSGTPEDCIQYLSSVTKADTVRYWEHYPASVILETQSTSVPDSILDTINKVSMAGVKVGAVLAYETSGTFRPCEQNVYFENTEVNVNPFPELEVGGDNMECGNPLAEFGPLSLSTNSGGVEEGDPLYGCVLPEYTDAYGVTFNLCGEPLMECGEPTAVCEDDLIPLLTSQGVLVEAYTYKGVAPSDTLPPLNISFCGEPLMECGEFYAVCSALPTG